MIKSAKRRKDNAIGHHNNRTTFIVVCVFTFMF